MSPQSSLIAGEAHGQPCPYYERSLCRAAPLFRALWRSLVLCCKIPVAVVWFAVFVWLSWRERDRDPQIVAGRGG